MPRRRCWNCGNSDCEDQFIPGPVRERACKTLCYQCGDYGHVGRDCPKRIEDANLQKPEYVKQLAQRCGWRLRPAGSGRNGYDHNNKTMFLVNDDGVKIDLYLGTMTVKTTLDHPVRGRNQMFRSGFHNEGKLKEILNDPRVHTGVGYRTEAGGTWLCHTCPGNNRRKNKAEFSKSQWSKRSKKKTIRCKVCLAA